MVPWVGKFGVQGLPNPDRLANQATSLGAHAAGPTIREMFHLCVVPPQASLSVRKNGARGRAADRLGRPVG